MNGSIELAEWQCKWICRVYKR